MGLSQVYAVAKAHVGSIDLVNNEGIRYYSYARSR